MPSDKSGSGRSLTGSFIEFYLQSDSTIRIRVYDSPNSFIYQLVMSNANFVTMVNNILANGTVMALAGVVGNYTRTSATLSPAGSDLTVQG